MRHSQQRPLRNLCVFAALLCVVLYINIPRPASWQANNKYLPWTRIRYRTTSTKLPEAHGICPGLETTIKPALVVSRVAADDDPKWLDTLEEKYHICVYTLDGSRDETSEHLQTPRNRGHEAMGYLTFLIDNYERIPQAGAVFVHGARWQWHNDHQDYDNLALLHDLDTSSALDPLGYHNLRCDWSSSTCAADYGASQSSLETSMNARLQPWDLRSASDAALPSALRELFGGAEYNKGAHLGRHQALRSQCCAQFIVSRERVWEHSREEYVALRQWLLDDGVAPADDMVAGRIISYLWHILFLGQASDGVPETVDLDSLNNMACPSAEECYCRLYGRCGLLNCKDGRCAGQYSVPPGFKLPADWAATHT